MHVPNLQISNFRALKSLHFERFSNINLFLAKTTAAKPVYSKLCFGGYTVTFGGYLRSAILNRL